MHRQISKDKLRLFTEFLFLLLFFFLLRAGNLQRWILIFGIGVLTSLGFGRLYCAWICPMATLFRPITWLYGKLKLNSIKTPALLSKVWTRWALLILLIGTMVFFKRFGIRLDLLLYVLIGAVITTLIFEEKFWHKYLCPYGTVLSVFSKSAYFGVTVAEDACVACGLCQKNCPNQAISTLKSGKRQIQRNECLTCFKCQEVCPTKAVEYSTSRSTPKQDRTIPQA